MRKKDDILLEQEYSKILKENEDKFQSHDAENETLSSDDRNWYFDEDGQPPYNVKYSNRTFNIRGKEVLIKQEMDQDDDSRWYYISLVDPETKERVFNDVTEDQIKKMFF
jgi:hypothetical protein